MIGRVRINRTRSVNNSAGKGNFTVALINILDGVFIFSLYATGNT
ncbi:hypothetical protein EMIT0P176_20268 [Pseudomonas sp. IT-P176]